MYLPILEYIFILSLDLQQISLSLSLSIYIYKSVLSDSELLLKDNGTLLYLIVIFQVI